MFRAPPSPFRLRVLSAAAPGLSPQTKQLDWQGGEFPVVNCRNLVAADFITYPEDVEGSNCGNCMYNGKGFCHFYDKEKGIDLRGQPVSPRNCCGQWDSPGTLRLGRRGCEGPQAKSLQPVTTALHVHSRRRTHGDDDLPLRPDPVDARLWEQCRAVAPQAMPSKESLPVEVGKVDGKTVVLVNGDQVRLDEEMDFIEGGNGYRYDFVPKDQIWIDAVEVRPEDAAFILYHEAFESRLMAKGESYDAAHKRANGTEWLLRQGKTHDGQAVRPAAKAMSAMNVTTGGALVGAKLPPSLLQTKRRGRSVLHASGKGRIERAKDKEGNEFCYDADKGAFARVPCGGASGTGATAPTAPAQHGAAVSGATLGVSGAPVPQSTPKQIEAQRQQGTANKAHAARNQPAGNEPAAMTAREMAEYLEGKQRGTSETLPPVTHSVGSQRFIKKLTDMAATSAKANGVGGREAEAMTNAVGAVLGRMSDSNLSRMSQALKSLQVVKDALEVTKRLDGNPDATYPRANGYFRPPMGYQTSLPLPGGRQLNIPLGQWGGKEIVLSAVVNKHSSKRIKSSNLEEGLAAHELSHALDYDGSKGWDNAVSGTAEWTEAWSEEIDFEEDESGLPGQEPISYYATTNKIEGFAEFGRALFSSKYSPAEIEQKFPKCAAVWRKHGIWPEG